MSNALTGLSASLMRRSSGIHTQGLPGATITNLRKLSSHVPPASCLAGHPNCALSSPTLQRLQLSGQNVSIVSEPPSIRRTNMDVSPYFIPSDCLLSSTLERSGSGIYAARSASPPTGNLSAPDICEQHYWTQSVTTEQPVAVSLHSELDLTPGRIGAVGTAVDIE